MTRIAFALFTLAAPTLSSVRPGVAEPTGRGVPTMADRATAAFIPASNAE